MSALSNWRSRASIAHLHTLYTLPLVLLFVTFFLLLFPLVSPVPHFHNGAALVKLQTRINDTTTTGAWLGPLGSCARVATTGDLSCTLPSFEPHYGTTMAHLNLPEALASTVIVRVTNTPAILLISIVTLLIGAILGAVGALPVYAPKRFVRLVDHAETILKVSSGTLVATFLLQTTAMVPFCIQFGHMVSRFNAAAANLGSEELANAVVYKAKMGSSFFCLYVAAAFIGFSAIMAFCASHCIKDFTVKRNGKTVGTGVWDGYKV